MSYIYRIVHHKRPGGDQWDIHVYFSDDHWWSAGRFDSEEAAERWIAKQRKHLQKTH